MAYAAPTIAVVQSTEALSCGTRPCINNFSPTSGTDGTAVAINGANFATSTGDNVVRIARVASMKPSTASSTSLSGPIDCYVCPPGTCVTAPITVAVGTRSGQLDTTWTDSNVPSNTSTATGITSFAATVGVAESADSFALNTPVCSTPRLAADATGLLVFDTSTTSWLTGTDYCVSLSFVTTAGSFGEALEFTFRITAGTATAAIVAEHLEHHVNQIATQGSLSLGASFSGTTVTVDPTNSMAEGLILIQDGAC